MRSIAESALPFAAPPLISPSRRCLSGGTMCDNASTPSMAHLALYRKYRPKAFDEVVGQEHVTRPLGNSVDRGTFVHAYLFSGPRGCGKTSTARLLAQALNCEKGPTSRPCGECAFCQTIPAGRCVDVIEMDAASETGIDDIRESVIERAKFPPMETRFKVYIIDEVHDLSAKAFDALLKTIEEPPQHVVFVLATTEWGKVPPTIRSRCQQHEFRRGSVPNLVARLKTVAAAEGIEAEPGALATIARMADGGFRDSLSLLEQVAGLAEGKITQELVNSTLGLISEEAAADILVACAERDGARVLARLDEVLDSGKEPRTVLESILYKVEELTRVAHGTPMPGVEPDRMALLQEQVARIGKETLLRVWPALAEAHAKLRTSGLPRVWLEVALLSLATAAETSVPKAEARPSAAAPPAPTKAVASAAVSAASPEIASDLRAPVVEEPLAPRPPEAEALDPVWTEVLRRISAKFPSAQKTLSGSRVVEVAGKKATVEVRSPLILERLSDPQHRTSRELVTMFREVIGQPGWSLEFRLRAEGTTPPPQPESVPRYLEGEELEKGVEEQLGGKRQ